MKLEEARKMAAELREKQKLSPLLETEHALVRIDDRITELEKRIDDMAEQTILMADGIERKVTAQRDELLETFGKTFLKALKEAVAVVEKIK